MQRQLRQTALFVANGADRRGLRRRYDAPGDQSRLAHVDRRVAVGGRRDTLAEAREFVPVWPALAQPRQLSSFGKQFDRSDQLQEIKCPSVLRNSEIAAHGPPAIPRFLMMIGRTLCDV
jgi:hypothetical protein